MRRLRRRLCVRVCLRLYVVPAHDRRGLPSQYKVTPLHVASMYRHTETARALPDAGADVNAVDKVLA